MPARDGRDAVHGTGGGFVSGRDPHATGVEAAGPRSGTGTSGRVRHPDTLGFMSAISSDEVARVAALARVALSEEEVTRLAGELDAVASAFARVTSVVTPDLPATSHPVPLTNVLREDVPGPTLDAGELLAGAPRAEGTMFLVPQILGEDSAS